MLHLVLATRYNGVYIDCSDDDFDKYPEEQMDAAQGAIGDLAEYTYEHAKLCEPHLTEEQVAELLKMAKEKVLPFLGEVEFAGLEYDEISS